MKVSNLFLALTVVLGCAQAYGYQERERYYGESIEDVSEEGLEDFLASGLFEGSDGLGFTFIGQGSVFINFGTGPLRRAEYEIDEDEELSITIDGQRLYTQGLFRDGNDLMSQDGRIVLKKAPGILQSRAAAVEKADGYWECLYEDLVYYEYVNGLKTVTKWIRYARQCEFGNYWR